MWGYETSDKAEADLIRIYQWGVRHHGKEQAHKLEKAAQSKATTILTNTGIDQQQF